MLLSVLVYDIIVRVFAFSVHMAAIRSRKARQWISGRKNWVADLQKVRPENRPCLWMHCASLGEFEQGRPVLEALREKYPSHFMILTFFSPSGYEVRKNYAGTDYTCYLPLDTGKNARELVGLIKPDLVIFVKYEFWYHYLSELRRRQVPVLLISAIFRKTQPFFKWYGGFFRSMLGNYDHLFVQDAGSLDLLQRHGIAAASVGGDTRFDRVLQIAGVSRDLPLIEAFIQGKKVFMAGSTWPEDEKLLRGTYDANYRWIIAPHEIHEGHIQQIEHLFAGMVVRYSRFQESPDQYQEKKILLIDNIGMLSSLYRYGFAAYIGGGFDQGIHNILEAAVYGMPVIFGPKYQKFSEAVDLVRIGAAFSVKDAMSLQHCLQKLDEDRSYVALAGQKAREYVKSRAGATTGIMQYIQEKRFLINS